MQSANAKVKMKGYKSWPGPYLNFAICILKFDFCIFFHVLKKQGVHTMTAKLFKGAEYLITEVTR